MWYTSGEDAKETTLFLNSNMKAPNTGAKLTEHQHRYPGFGAQVNIIETSIASSTTISGLVLLTRANQTH